jgi:AcrR family transcriptional regulator
MARAARPKGKEARAAAEPHAKASPRADQKPVAVPNDVAEPLRKRRALSPEARREAILAAALEEFTARGYEGARLDDVARRAGVAKGTIYLYFTDKQALFQDLVRSMVNPILGTLEQLPAIDLPARVIVERLTDTFVREIIGTRRKDIIRLILTEGARFPEIAEFYHREVIARVLGFIRPMLARAAARGELPEGVARFPQLLVAPGLVGIIWGGLFDKFEPLDAAAMMRAHVEILFSGRPK